jgi:outer membrane murein-binding lipoprotein Lpp
MGRWIVLAAAAAMLVGCADADSVDVADVNARNALAKAEALSSRVEELESRVDELEARLNE